jgi:hypothetical protein
MPNVTIGEALGQSFRFIGTAWRHAWGIMLISVWLTGTLQAIQGLRPEWAFGILLLSIPLNVLVGTAVIGALYRIGIEPFHGGDTNFRAAPTGLQWGGLEWRVLGANLLMGLIFGGVTFFFSIIVLVLIGATAGSDSASLAALNGSDPTASSQALLHILTGPAGIVSLLLFLVVAGAFLFFAARLLVFSLLAADTGAFSFGRAWVLTRGALGAIIVTLLMFGLLQVAIWFVGLMITGGFAAAHGQIFWGSVAIAVATGAIITPLSVGLQIYVYNTRRSGEPSIAATFS